ncbi:8-oxo-dGTP pyrophosphatase MutT (NUDIX family) [Kineosphaera limosa]|uniref:Nudix hydrolase domain-containing protein n=1 Tax=Kineosphaera limosa NBRC 100340 TaxID=1184609 RepID=K6X7Y6_9MICO|nr:DUF4031 domain-containing protein [Kineosphaera limosa]NYE00890.1 8-oxo-dGTP pyrophosphatase MutT (NUDIX family) [Kineosphaera limosa]GAB94914.1 hypothetical protein KILIM_014_00500 [Kineosphaera limosa NBRC 100340]
MILLDPPVWPFRDQLFSHLASDTSIEELHDFAGATGLHPRSYDGDHYDVPASRYDEVVAAGAVPVSNRELLAAVQRAGLRFRKRRGERPLASIVNGLPSLGAPHRLEILRSPFEAPPESTIAAVTAVTDADSRLLLVGSPKRGGWECPGGKREPGETPRESAVREVAEEAGIELAPDLLARVGYERIRFAGPVPDPQLHPISHVAVYGAQLESIGQDGIGPEGQPVVWLPPEQVWDRCGAAPWWPLLDRHLFG